MKTIIAILLALFSTCAVNAQTYTLNQLVGTKWKESMLPERIISTMEFASNEIKFNAKLYSATTGELNYNLNSSQKYYLSNSIPVSFDKTKVGKVQKGSYIIKYNNKMNCMEYFYIKSLTKDKLVLYHKRDPKDIDDSNYTLYYERVK
ncbi:MAG: hypothetical protein K5874_01530 [Bacteroidaceae bacterium]|nr:hypothetical protein [Bacteroidaceae bacterium]